MASKKTSSQAEAAANKAVKKDTSRKKTTKTPKKTENQEPVIEEQLKIKDANQMPLRLITSLVCVVLFVIFLVMFLKPDGKILEWGYSLLLGLFGKATFVVSIPALLYLFIIQAFSGHQPVKMRSICLICFVLICGCIFHLVCSPMGIPAGFKAVPELYQTGMAGKSGGVLCGGLAMLTETLFGTIISYVIFIVSAVLTILATFRITIRSLVRAVRNRPKEEWETEKKAPTQEPAEVVVNTIVQKSHAISEKRKAKQENNAAASEKKKKAARASDLMSQIEGDVTAPVAAAGSRVEADDEEAVLTSVPEEAPEEELRQAKDQLDDLFENSMPRLEISESEEEPMVTPEEEPEEDPEVPVMDDEIPEQEPVEETVIADTSFVEEAPSEAPVQPGLEKVTSKDAKNSAAEVAAEIEKAQAAPKPVYAYPPISLLDSPKKSGPDGTDEMRENSRRLNETLESFKIEAHIINVTRGPSVTRYEVELDKGVRLNKLTSCADDIALSLGASGVRIAAVPGKISVVGIEVPNRAVTTVTLREVIDSQEFRNAKSRTSFAVGKDIGGSCIVGNISKLPHMLIAGTTGSGKSVCMNSIIISLLYKASPEDVKLIMVDPKMVELGIYNGIPHLLIPVVTDPKKAAGSLQWAVSEMMRRYRAMSDAGVRDLHAYNSIIDNQEIEGEKLPHVVVIIDELADLMLVAAKEVEESICRIAQMGRAAGIHLIIATQRPSADVITGLMKANIPSRIAFAVASAMESRIILDTQGAEKLVGKGDMLYAPIGCGKPKRVQGCFVSDGEVEEVASYVKNNYDVAYDQSVMEEIDKKAAQTGNKAPAAEPEANADELAVDEMLYQAVDVILETNQASVSMLQRRLKLGYARAARIVDEMEEMGVVGPFKGSKPREILVTKEQWQAMRSGGAQEEPEEEPELFEEPEEEIE